MNRLRSVPWVYFLMPIQAWILWELIIKVTGVPSFLLPPPSMVAGVVLEDLPELLYHTGITVGAATIGYVFANVLAITLAVILLYVTWLEGTFMAWSVVVSKIPLVSIATMLYLILGTSPTMVILVVVLFTFFTILANLNMGLKEVKPVLLDRMKVLNASQWQVFRNVRWPNALPYYFAAHRAAFTGSIISAVVAEWLFPKRGLGRLLVNAMTAYRADKLWAATGFSLLATLFALLVVVIAEKQVFKWKSE